MKQLSNGATMTVAPAGRAMFFGLAVALVSACASGPSSQAKGNLAAAMKQANIGPRAETPISQAELGLRGFVAAKDMSNIKVAMAAMPTDTLLRLLNWGLAYHRLGMFAESNSSLQAAEAEAEKRYTKSISKAVLAATLGNDNSMDYNPSAMERAFVHYYGMLNYLALNNTEDALVEARKVDEFLARYARENGARSFTTDATVEYVSGLLHLSEGDPNDAMQAFRKTALGLDNYGNKYGIQAPQFVGADVVRLASFMGIDELKAQLVPRYQLQPDMMTRPANTGTLLVLVENGYIAYRAEQKLYFPLTPGEGAQLKTLAGAAIVGPLVVKRAYDIFTAASQSGEYASDYSDGIMFGVMLTNADLVTMAWPKYVLNTNGAEEITVVAGSVQMPATVMDDLSAIAARQFEEDKPKIVERMVLRGMTKFAAAKMAESEVKSKSGGGIQGQVLGFLAKQGAQKLASASEKADIRSWSLLPGEIRVARFDLPAGVHEITVNAVDSDGSTKAYKLGPVTIQPNKVVVKSQFVTGQYKGSVRRFANAKKGVDYKAATDTAAGRASTLLAFTSAAPVAVAPVAPVALAGAPGVAAPAPAAAAKANTPAAPARAAAAVTRVIPLTPEFKPLDGQSARFALAYKDAGPAGSPKATTSLLVVRPGTTDTLRVWSGAEGDTAFWNGLKDDAPVAAGTYNFIWRTQTPGVAAVTNLVLPGAVEVNAPKVEPIAKPAEPTMEPETRQVLRPDYSAKSSKKKKGIILGLLGAGAMYGGVMMIESAIESSPPGSTQRMTALGVWGGGLFFSTAGGISFLNGALKSYMHPVNEPDRGAMDRNKQAKEDYANTLEQIRLQDEMLKDKTLIRIRVGAGR
jgi:uncharacterized protein